MPAPRHAPVKQDPSLPDPGTPPPDAPPEPPPGPETENLPSPPAESGTAADVPATETEPPRLPAVRRDTLPVPGGVVLAGGELWERIFAACESGRRNNQVWEAYQPNLPQALYEALTDRVSDDHDRTDNWDLAASHYLEVAVSLMPVDPDGRIDAAAAHAEGVAWLNARPRRRSAGGRAATGSQLKIITKRRMRKLVDDLKKPALRPKIPVWMVIAAYVEKLLSELDKTPPPGL